MDTTEREERGSPSIGSPTQKTESLPRALASTQGKSLRDSETTGSPGPGPEEPSWTGPRLGGTGVAARRPGEVQTVMALGDPAATDRALTALWARRLGSLPVERVKSIYDDDYGYDERLISIERPAQWSMELDHELRQALIPADSAYVTKELARLKIATVGRKMGDVDLEAWLEVAGEELERFPCDVVRAACRESVRREKWTPSVSELVARCEEMVRYRRLMFGACAAAGPALARI